MHPEFLAKQKLPPKLVGKNLWEERFKDIRNFEQFSRNGVVVRKFFYTFQRKSRNNDVLERIDDPLKNWKFSSNDASERDFWTVTWERMKRYSGNRNERGAMVCGAGGQQMVYARRRRRGRVRDPRLARSEYPKVDEGKLKELAAAKKKLVSK